MIATRRDTDSAYLHDYNKGQKEVIYQFLMMMISH